MVVLYFTTTLHENLHISESEMMKFRPQYRVHVPNTLAIFAVVLLLISSVTGVENNQETNASGQQITNSVKVDSAGDREVEGRAVDQVKRGRSPVESEPLEDHLADIQDRGAGIAGELERVDP